MSASLLRNGSSAARSLVAAGAQRSFPLGGASALRAASWRHEILRSTFGATWEGYYRTQHRGKSTKSMNIGDMQPRYFTREDTKEETQKHKPPKDKSKATFDTTGSTLSNRMYTRAMSPHLTAVRGEFNTLLSISSRIGGTVLVLIPTFFFPSLAYPFIQYIPVGNLYALGYFSAFSLAAHLLFVYAQYDYGLYRPWNEKPDRWHV